MKQILYNNTYLYVPDRYYHNNLENRFNNKNYEKDEVYMIAKYYREKDNVLEIGSCLGYTASKLSKKVNSVVSLEANPELQEVLGIMKDKNKLSNVNFVSGFLSETRKYVDFQTYDNIVAGSGDREDMEINNVRGWGDSLINYKLKTIKTSEIPLIENINTLFLDMEGGELILFEENSNFISKQINKVTVELHGHQMKMNDDIFNKKCCNILISCGLKFKERSGNTYHFERHN